MKKSLFATVLMLAAVSLSAAELVEGIVIRVGDRIVTRTQYEQRLGDVFREIERAVPAAEVEKARAEARQNLTNELISELLIRDRADRLGITVTDAEVAESIGRLKQQYGITSDEQFQESLRSSGLTRAEMEARLRETLITNKVFGRELRSRTEATDAELRERYSREKEEYRLPERAQLREIVILKPEAPGRLEEARQKASEVAEAARKPGTDFAKLASTMSEAGSADSGGSLGEVAKGDLVAELDQAVFNAAAGSVVGPIETRSAWHIVRVERRLPSEVPAFESIKERLRRDASEETFQRDFKAYVETLRKDAFIQVNEEMIPRV